MGASGEGPRDRGVVKDLQGETLTGYRGLDDESRVLEYTLP